MTIKIGQMVKLQLPHATEPKGFHTVAGFVKRILEDGRIEVKTQNHGYHVVTASELMTK